MFIWQYTNIKKLDPILVTYVNNNDEWQGHQVKNPPQKIFNKDKHNLNQKIIKILCRMDVSYLFIVGIIILQTINQIDIWKSKLTVLISTASAATWCSCGQRNNSRPNPMASKSKQYSLRLDYRGTNDILFIHGEHCDIYFPITWNSSRVSYIKHLYLVRGPCGILLPTKEGLK